MQPTPGDYSQLDFARWGFADDAVVVTGSGSGIGRATAVACARAGLRVGVWDMAADSAAATSDTIASAGGVAYALTVDVSDKAAIAEGFKTTKAALGPIRYLVNNAGPRAADPHSFDEGLRLGAGSVELVTASWLAASPPEPAAVVNVASVAGAIVGSEPTWYAANKAAIAGYTRALAITVAPAVRVNAVAPSLVNTPRVGKWTDSDQGRQWAEINPLKRWAVADDIAYPILFLLSPFAGYVNGVLLPIDAGQTLIL